jgi:hypothetical protein
MRAGGENPPGALLCSLALAHPFELPGYLDHLVFIPSLALSQPCGLPVYPTTSRDVVFVWLRSFAGVETVNRLKR